MDKFKIREIGEERLGNWLDDLVEANATPVCLIGVCHGSKLGELEICTVEDLSILDIRLILSRADKLLSMEKFTEVHKKRD